MDFYLLLKNIGKNIVKNISKNLSGKYGSGMLAMRQELLHHAKQSAADALKTSLKRVIRKTAEATGDLISIEINDESRGKYNTNSQIRFKTSMLRSSLCNYNDAYILAKETITVVNTAAADEQSNITNRKIIFKNCAPFTSCISRINNTQIDGAQYIDVVIPMYNLKEYCVIIQKHLKYIAILQRCTSCR